MQQSHLRSVAFLDADGQIVLRAEGIRSRVRNVRLGCDADALAAFARIPLLLVGQDALSCTG